MKFKYRGYDAQSTERIGTLEADSYSEAYAALNYQGVTVIRLEATRPNLLQAAENFLLKQKLGGQWRSVFFRQLGVMLGVMTLHDALKTLARAATGHPSEKILSQLVTAVGEGQSFGTALARWENIFGSDAVQSVTIGEAGGSLQDVASRLAVRLERNYVTESKVRGAMYYPAFVLMAALVAAVVLVNVTLPVFDSFFAQQGANLPLVTLMFLRGGKFLAQHWLAIAVAFAMFAAGLTVLINESDAVKIFVDRLKLNVKLLREAELRNFFGRMSFLLESGVTLDEALKICAAATKNLVMQKILGDIKFSVERGESLANLVGKHNFPPLYVGLIVTGETGGELVNMLRQCESMADFQVEKILSTLPAKAELIGTLLAGLIVATLVFAVMLPIFDMTTIL
ncbi:MAG: type II secretion system F family protein [Quinella sp. 2Q5]|nr:type II secretion system F family protein [Quinella sp. 2Q5]